MTDTISDLLQEDLFVFAYGSLIWKPGFSYTSRAPARLWGYRRAYCISSQFYRGTPEAPGLVLGLEQGDCCEGVAYRVCQKHRDEALDYLRERENVYDEKIVNVEMRCGQIVPAITFVANPNHEQYVAMTDFDAAMAVIATARGTAGPNYEYALNTWNELRGLGIHDPLLERVAQAVQEKVLQTQILQA